MFFTLWFSKALSSHRSTHVLFLTFKSSLSCFVECSFLSGDYTKPYQLFIKVFILRSANCSLQLLVGHESALAHGQHTDFAVVNADQVESIILFNFLSFCTFTEDLFVFFPRKCFLSAAAMAVYQTTMSHST